MLKIAWSTCQNRIYSKDQMVHFYINRPTMLVGLYGSTNYSFPHLLQLRKLCSYTVWYFCYLSYILDLNKIAHKHTVTYSYSSTCVATGTIKHKTLVNLANHQSAFRVPKIDGIFNTQLPLSDHSSNFFLQPWIC